MSALDIEGLIIADYEGKVLYKRVFAGGEDVSLTMAKGAVKCWEEIQILMDKIVMTKRLDKVFLIVYSSHSVNEVFVSQAFEGFTTAFLSIVKTADRNHVISKYDQVVLLVDEFVYEGVILSVKAEEMLHRLPKRSFESVSGMKVPKGFASLIHKATKSFGMK